MRQLVHKLSSWLVGFKKNKKINKSGILFFLILFLIFIQVLIMNPKDIGSPNQDPKTVEEIQKMAVSQNKKSNQKSVEQQMKGVHLVENSNRMKGWELFAEVANGSADAQWVLKKVKIDFFAEDQSSYTVTGDVGEIDGATKNILIRGQVITTSTNGYSFKTNDLHFIAENKSLKSDDSVVMNGPADQTGGGFELNGIGFVIDLNKNKMSIMSSVQAHKVIKEKNIDLNSESAVFSNKNQEGQFSGRVRLKYDKSLITSPEAFFKYSSTEKKLKTILLKDKVTIKESDRVGSCQELEIDFGNDAEGDQMILRGSPKVQMQDDEITGNEIVFTDGGQKVKINNVKVTGFGNEKMSDTQKDKK